MKGLLGIVIGAAVFWPSMEIQTQEQVTVLKGTMQWLNIQGGCWVLENDKGLRYELVGKESLLQPLRKEGLRVTVAVQEDPELVGKCMVGRMVRVIRVIQVQKKEGNLVPSKLSSMVLNILDRATMAERV